MNSTGLLPYKSQEGTTRKEVLNGQIRTNLQTKLDGG